MNFLKEKRSKDIRSGVTGRFLYVLSFVLLLSCEAPKPRDENVRIPVLISEGLRVREGETLNLALAAKLPDPEFKSDRLNEERYAPGDLSFSCTGNCPSGLRIDQLTGIITWEVSFDDAGFHNIIFRVVSDIYFSEKALGFIVIDSDRPPEAKDDQIFTVKEGELFDTDLVSTDPDGDPVQFACESGCRDFIQISSEGKVSIAPSFSDSGSYKVKLKALSNPSSRGGVFIGVPLEEDTPSFRSIVEEEVLNRDVVLTSENTLTVDIENVDRGPEFEKEEYRHEVSEGESLAFGVKAADPDGDLLIYSCLDGCPPGVAVDGGSGLITYRPGYQDAGEYKFSVSAESVTDANSRTLTSVFIRVNNVNRPPRFSELPQPKSIQEGELLSLPLRANDPDGGDVLTFKCLSGCPSGFFVSSNGFAVFLPGYDQSGVYNIVFSVSDGVLEAEAPFSLTVRHVNRKPYFLAAPSLVDMQAQLAINMKLTVRDDDIEDVGKLTIVCKSGCIGPKTFSTSTATLTWLTTFDDVGDHVFTFEVSDGVLSTEHTTTIKVSRTDRAPKFISTIAISGTEFIPLTFKVEALDPDEDSVTYSCVRNCPEGLVLDSVTGDVSWTPGGRQSGSYAVGIRATSIAVWNNNSVKTSDTNVNIFIADTNRPPFLINDVDPLSGSVFENAHNSALFTSETNSPYLNSVLAGDPDGDVLAYFCMENCPNNLLVDMATGAVSWTPDYTQAKPQEAPYQGIVVGATDGSFNIRSTPFSVVVYDVNRSPVFNPINMVQSSFCGATSFGPPPPNTVNIFESAHCSAAVSSAKNRPFQLTVKANDLDNDPIVYSCSENCPEGLVVNSNTGLVSWIPTYEQSKLGEIAYGNIVFAASDGKSVSLSTSINIIVRNVNRLPTKNSEPLSIISVNENAHRDQSGGLELFQMPTDAPLDFYLSASDPDGDPVVYGMQCTSGSLPCLSGITLDQSSGRVSFTPGYCRADEAACQPAFTGNSAARNLNGAYAPISFYVSDGSSSVFFNSVSVTIKNVDRPPAFIAQPANNVTIYEGWTPVSSLPVADQGFALSRLSQMLPVSLINQREANPSIEPSSLNIELSISDPDGDAVAAVCQVQRTVMTIGAPNRGDTETVSCTRPSGTGQLQPSAFPPASEFNPPSSKSELVRLFRPRDIFGQVLPFWNVAYKATGASGQAGGFFDAQFQNEPYIIDYTFTSTSSSGQQKELRFSQNLHIINTDRFARLDRSGLNELGDVSECPEDPLAPAPKIRNVYPCDYAGVNVENGYAIRKLDSAGNELDVVEIKIREGVNRSFPITQSSLITDPDSLNNQFSDTAIIGCRLFSDSQFLTTAKNLNGDDIHCDLDEAPNGAAPNIGISVRNGVKTFVLNPSFSDAQINNAPYYIEVYTASETNEEEYARTLYPTLYDGLRFAIAVVNVDRAPSFGSSVTIGAAREPCGSQVLSNISTCPPGTAGFNSPEAPNGAVYKQTSPLISGTINDADIVSNSGNGVVDEVPSFTILGCSSTRNALTLNECKIDFCQSQNRRGIFEACDYQGCSDFGPSIGFLQQCPDFISENGGKIEVTPYSYKSAMMNELGSSLPLIVRIATTGCPNEETGWRGGCSLPGSLESLISGSNSNLATFEVDVTNSLRAPGPLSVNIQKKRTSDSTYSPVVATSNYININETDSLKLEVSVTSEEQAPLIICAADLNANRSGNIPPSIVSQFYLTENEYSNLSLSSLDPLVTVSGYSQFINSLLIARTGGNGVATTDLVLGGLSSQRDLVSRQMPRRTIALGLYACSVNVENTINPTDGLARQTICPVSRSGVSPDAGQYACSEATAIGGGSWANLSGPSLGSSAGTKSTMIAVWDEDRQPTVSSHTINGGAATSGQTVTVNENTNVLEFVSLNDNDINDKDILGVYHSFANLNCNTSPAALSPTSGGDSDPIYISKNQVCLSSPPEKWGSTGFSNTITYPTNYDTTVKSVPVKTFSVSGYRICYTSPLGSFGGIPRSDGPSGASVFIDDCLSSSPLSSFNFTIRVNNVDRTPEIVGVDSGSQNRKTFNFDGSREEIIENPFVFSGATESQSNQVNEYDLPLAFSLTGEDPDKEDNLVTISNFRLCPGGRSSLNDISNNSYSYPISVSGNQLVFSVSGDDPVEREKNRFELINPNTPGGTFTQGANKRPPVKSVSLCLQACTGPGVGCGSDYVTNFSINDSDRLSFEPNNAVLNPSDDRYYLPAIKMEQNNSMRTCSSHTGARDFVKQQLLDRVSIDSTSVFQDLDVGDSSPSYFNDLNFFSNYSSCTVSSICTRSIDIHIKDPILNQTIFKFSGCIERADFTKSRWNVSAKTNGANGKSFNVTFCNLSEPEQDSGAAGQVWNFVTFNGQAALIDSLLANGIPLSGDGYVCD